MADEPTRMGDLDPERTIGPEDDDTEVISGDRTATLGQTETKLAGSPSQKPSQPIPETIGAYRIIAKLGEGGMGVVYEAEQQQPKRKVALKVIRGGQVVDDQSLKLFQREANSLARLKHPGIAAIYESGCTDDGQHYFVMELVRGVTLARYLEERPESITPKVLKERLHLFAKICDAVHYAHQRGVIHRDLKPGNVIVAEATADTESTISGSLTPEIKILDFGLARITDTDVAATQVSEVGMIKGTLRYMSPEQARGDPDEIDVRSDVYALGVILYEMLTGKSPYDLQKASLVDALRVILEVEPTPMSQSWSGVRRLDSDLETIAGKALEKLADRRYGSAAALSMDIGRYLTSQPILARPPSSMYQLKKMVDRNKGPTAFAATVLVLLVGFGIWMSVLYTEAEANLERALLAEDEAEHEAEFMMEMFNVSDPSEARGNSITAREVLDRGAAEIRTGLKDQPRLQGRLMDTMGKVYRNLGLYSQAAPLLEDAIQVRRSSLGPDDIELAESLNSLAAAYIKQGQPNEAFPLLEEALAIQERLLDPNDPEIARTLNNLGGIAIRRGESQRCLELWERTLAIREQAFGPESSEVARVLGNLAIVHKEMDEHDLAKERLERAITISEKIMGADDPKVARLYQNLAVQHEDSGKYEEALAPALHALEIQRKVLEEGHPEIARTLNTLGKIQLGRLEFGDARIVLEEALAIQVVKLGDAHRRTTFTRTNLIEALHGLGAHREMIPLLETKIGQLRALLGEDSSELVEPLRLLAEALRKTGRPADAEAVLARAESIQPAT